MLYFPSTRYALYARAKTDAHIVRVTGGQFVKTLLAGGTRIFVFTNRPRSLERNSHFVIHRLFKKIILEWLLNTVLSCYEKYSWNKAILYPKSQFERSEIFKRVFLEINFCRWTRTWATSWKRWRNYPKDAYNQHSFNNTEGSVLLSL